MRPIETLKQFALGKVPLYAEVNFNAIDYLLEREGNNSLYRDRLLQYSKKAACSSLVHFKNDNRNFSDVRQAIASGNYAVSEYMRDEISKRIDIIKKETLEFDRFNKKARVVSSDSKVLEGLLNTTNLLICVELKNNIDIVSNLI